ncbi:CHAT domain-containing protein [Streptomyces sp. NPDC007905]|uniref:CHAT domain-containing protein n=1 Tax=Streptomyces sp. NPDC007905 TaxID=3364788 RepID=UPI0036E0C186
MTLTALLLTEQRKADPAALLVEPDRLPPGACGIRLAAAAALAAGEPKRALAVLDTSPAGERSALERALRTAALHLDVNWQPGACLAPVEGLARAMAHGAGDLPEGSLRLPWHLAGHVIPVLLSARMIVGHAGRAGDERECESHHALRGEVASERNEDLWESVDEALRWFDQLHETIAEAGHREASACHLLLAADLRVRAGDREAANPLVRTGLQYVSGDPASTGLSEILQGDWQLGAPGIAEECLVPTGAAPGATVPPSTRHQWRRPGPLGAADRYAAAEAAYTAAGSQRGRAAALLRLAHVHRIRGEAEDCRAKLTSALSAAQKAGDGAYTALLRVHQVLDLIDTDTGEGAEAEVAASVAGWGRTVGSTSWVRGLSWLVRNRAASWYAQGYARRGDRAEALARLLTDARDGGQGNAAAVPTRGAVLQARHRLATMVLTDLEQREHLARIRRDGDPDVSLDLTGCVGVVQAAKVFHTQASALWDPEAVAAARSRIERALRVGELVVAKAPPWIAEQMRETLATLRSDFAACPAQESLFRSRRAREAGLGEEADRLANEALTRAGSIPDEVLRCHVRCAALADLGERERACAEAEAVESRLPALQAAALWVRLGSPERARRHLPLIGTAGAGAEHSWQLAGLQAEIALADESRPQDAAEYALSGLAAYEEHRLRLARDSLRASFADDPVPARLHHTAVLARLASGERDAAAIAFTQAERGRIGVLGAVRALDAAGEDPAARAAVRGWLAAEVRWAAEFEEHMAVLRAESAAARRSEHTTGDPVVTPPPAQVEAAERRRRIDDAARRLGEAETAVQRRAPRALATSGGEAVPDAAAVAEALPPDTVLLAYHLFDDSLVGWAMTREALRVEALTGCPGRRQLMHQVVGAARRFRDRCARPAAGEHVQDDGTRLTTWLLEPFAGQLGSARRVIVVPPAVLALLPFHVLPWDGDALGTNRAVSYLPAAGLLPRLRARRPQRPWKELSALLVGSPATDPRRGLPHLPGTAAETAEIARLLPGSRLLTGAGATRAEVLATAPAHEVLHFAAHGVIDERAPNRSRLPLAGDDSLDLADLLSSADSPWLLVLSACDTGRGRATAGGDVLGLSRAALVTGARHAVVSLWPVHDGDGALVMTRMYRRLVGDPGADVGTALSLAQQEVRARSRAERDEEFRELSLRSGAEPESGDRARSWAANPRDIEPVGPAHAAGAPHPYYWAPFIHVGV